MESHANCLAFSSFIRANLQALHGFQTHREYERGQTVYCMGDAADEVYLIDRGRVKIVRISADGQQKILSIYQNGDCFGELCICGGTKRSEQAVALESLKVTSFHVQGLLKILRKRPEMVVALLLVICARLREAHDQIATLAFENIPRRLAREILQLSRSANATPAPPGEQVRLNLTHEELSHLVGTSREMITTVMNQFRERGLVDYTRRNILVHPERLQAFLERT
ncbi:MAG: Crp/Fnr family transcriptional regulator [Terriglobia bacterium]